jgi:hypothetical protein
LANGIAKCWNDDGSLYKEEEICMERTKTMLVILTNRRLGDIKWIQKRDKELNFDLYKKFELMQFRSILIHSSKS